MSSVTVWFTNKKAALLLLGAMLIYCITILVRSTGTFDYGDGITHYFISRYSWKHHELFLDDWGKPLFTLIASPFAQFGLKGIMFFNILCGLSAGYLAYKLAEKFSIPYPFFAIIFTVSAPIYLSVMNSGLTEPLFTALLMLCIWFIVNDKYYLSAVIFSFLPFVRAEYVFVLPLFGLYYIIKRKYKAILLLLTGTIFYSLIGWFHYGNILWLITQNPYKASNAGGYADAGNGDFLAYVNQRENIIGSALIKLLLAGLLCYIWAAYNSIFKKKDKRNGLLLAELLLVFGSALFIFVCHSVLWGKRIFPTLGLARYMSTLIPILSIVALRGLQVICLIIPKSMKIVNLGIGLVFAAFVLYAPYKLWYNIPFVPEKTEQLVFEATDWLKEHNYSERKIYYQTPCAVIGLDIDPYDSSRDIQLWGIDPVKPSQNMDMGGILIWDAHYAAEEGRMKLEDLLNDDKLQLLHVFKPDEPFKVIGNRNYEIYVFEAVEKKHNDTILSHSTQLSKTPTVITCNAEQRNSNKDFVSDSGVVFGNGESIDSSKAHSGRYSVKLNGKYPFGFTLKYNVLPGDSIYATVYRYANKSNNGFLVASCGKSFYVQTDSAIGTDSAGWDKLMLRFKVPFDYSDFKLYVWNDKSTPVWFDDMKFVRIPEK